MACPKGQCPVACLPMPSRGGCRTVSPDERGTHCLGWIHDLLTRYGSQVNSTGPLHESTLRDKP
eukprot:scaffold499893_cov20-Prasinocladus_malaysianus.AAC.1